MVVAPSFHRGEALALNTLNARRRRVAIGLHVTLTAPFRPLSEGFAPLRDGAFLLARHARAARQPAPPRSQTRWRRRSRASCARSSSISAARPTSSTATSMCICSRRCATRCSTVAKTDAPDAWLRQCGRVPPFDGQLARSQGPAPRRAEPQLPPPRRSARRAHQSGLRRHLRVQRTRRISPRCFRAFSTGCRTAAW